MQASRIAIFASSFYPHLGGVEELVRQLAKTYRKHGVTAIVLTNRWPRSLPEHEQYEGIEIYRLAMRVPEGSAKAHVSYRLTHRAITQQTVAILERHKTQAIHVQCVSSNGHYALAASRRLNLPLIVTSQGERTMDAGSVYDTSDFLNGTLRLLLDKADFVTACSQNTLADLEEYRGQKFGARGRVVYNGIEITDFQNAVPFSHPRPYILGIGRLVPQKGFDLLLRAFARADVESHDLILAGDGPENERLQKLAGELGIEKRVVFFGRADRPTAASLFKGCDFFVLPSRHEPFGIVNLEAMAAGKTVVAARVGGVPEIVTHGKDGLLVAPDDAEALAHALSTLAGDESLKNRLAAAGHARVADFSWTCIARQYFEIYQNALNARQSQPATAPSLVQATLDESAAL
jgi:glycosyltransferase involved in cell wall biosynthesis